MNIAGIIDTIPFSGGCGVVKVDESGALAIFKRAGRSTHPNHKSGSSVPMINASYSFEGEYYSWPNPNGGKNVHLYLANRLDSPTSGIVIASFDEEIAGYIRDLFKKKLVMKTYYAVCVGRVFQKFGEWRDRLELKREASFVRSEVSAGTGRIAVSSFFIERSDANGANLNLVRLEPKTGFTHQLRVQCARHRMPILGDATYGNFALNRAYSKIFGIGRMFLHCSKTSFSLECGRQFEAESPLPDSFSLALDYNVEIARKFNKTTH